MPYALRVYMTIRTGINTMPYEFKALMMLLLLGVAGMKALIALESHESPK
jgi:hypothetical protein